MQQDKEIQGILIGKENNKTAFACRCHLYTKSERTVKKKMFICRGKRPRIANIILKEKKVRGLRLPILKLPSSRQCGESTDERIDI